MSDINKVTIVPFFLLLALSACSRAPDSPPKASAPVATATPDAAAKSSQSTTYQKVTISLHVRVADVSGTVERLHPVIAKHRGYIAKYNFQQKKDAEAAVEIRIPRDEEAPCLGQIKTLGELLAEDRTVEDITGQVIDLKTRIANAKRHEARLLGLLTENTGNLQEVLAVEKEVARIRGTIEQLQARERSVDQQVSYTEVYLTLVPEGSVLFAQPLSKMWRALKDGVTFVRNLVLGICVMLAYSLPTLVLLSSILACVLLAVRYTKRRKYKKGAARK